MCRYIQNENPFELIFLDIELENMSGIHVGYLIRKEFNDHNTEIIYISGKSEYALNLFDKHPLDFLIKPLDSAMIIAKVEQALRKWGDDESFFTFKIGTEAYRVKYHDILFFRSNGRIITLYTVKEFYDKLKEALNNLPHRFLQIHKSIIINFDKVIKYDCNSVTMENGSKLKVSKTYHTPIR